MFVFSSYKREITSSHTMLPLLILVRHTQSEDFLSSSAQLTNPVSGLGRNGAPLEKYQIRVILLFELLKSGVIFSEEGLGINFGPSVSHGSV